MWYRSRDRCLNFNPLNISGEIRWGGGESNGHAGTMLRRIPSLFLNDAWIYSEDALAGTAWQVCFASPCLNYIFGHRRLPKTFAKLYVLFVLCFAMIFCGVSRCISMTVNERLITIVILQPWWSNYNVMHSKHVE